jgi:tetratricopeptide (TPR) repeat protein
VQAAVPNSRIAATVPARAPEGAIPVPPQPTPRAAPVRPRPAAPVATAVEGAAAERRTPVALVPSRTLDRELDAAYDAFEAGDLASARQRYQQVLRADPTNRDANLGLAAIDVRAGDTGVAESRYQKLLERDPRDPYAQAALSALRPAQDPVQSESRLKTLISQQPDSGPLQFALGNLYSGQSRWSEAQAAYFRAYNADPDNADFAYNLAVSLDHLRQPRLALEYYQRALALAGQRPASFDRTSAAARARDLER